jgi:hypothetical protein
LNFVAECGFHVNGTGASGEHILSLQHEDYAVDSSLLSRSEADKLLNELKSLESSELDEIKLSIVGRLNTWKSRASAVPFWKINVTAMPYYLIGR